MSLIRKLHFNLWYIGKTPWDSGISPPELIEFIGTHPPGRALDIGCGTGTNVVTLAQAGWQVMGFDFASQAIRRARKKAGAAKITAELVVDDATKMENVHGLFNLALDLGCFHGIAEKAKYLARLVRILSPDGFWLMYGIFKPSRSISGPGLLETDLDMIKANGLSLLSRRDGIDKRARSSVWLLFQKP
jgi:ubiquinone/menaquinone biosynthesis C-methylase UbiE